MNAKGLMLAAAVLLGLAALVYLTYGQSQIGPTPSANPTPQPGAANLCLEGLGFDSVCVGDTLVTRVCVNDSIKTFSEECGIDSKLAEGRCVTSGGNASCVTTFKPEAASFRRGRILEGPAEPPE